MKINTILININISNISLILILCDLIFSNYTINILIELITFLIIQIILKIHYKQNKINYNDSHLLYYLIYIYMINNVIYMDNTEYLTLYNNIYIKGLNSLVNKYGELIAYAVGVKLSSIYLKILPTEPTFYFHFGLGVGPTLDLTV